MFLTLWVKNDPCYAFAYIFSGIHSRVKSKPTLHFGAARFVFILVILTSFPALFAFFQA